MLIEGYGNNVVLFHVFCDENVVLLIYVVA